MVSGYESRKIHRAPGTRAFLTVAALFAMAALTSPARAQEASETDSVAAIEGVDFVDRTIYAFAPVGTSFRDAPRLNLGEASRTSTAGEEAGDDEIVVTAHRDEVFAVTPDPDFTRNFFADAGMTTNYNPQNAGLELFPIRRDDIEGWRGVDVDLFNSGRFSIEAQVKRGAGFEFTYRFGGN